MNVLPYACACVCAFVLSQHISLCVSLLLLKMKEGKKEGL